MVKSTASTADEYIAQLPEDRRNDIKTVREVVLKNLPPGYEECVQFGMIAYVVPLATLPTPNKQPLGFAALASQKNYMALFLNNVYSAPEVEHWFREA